MAVDERGNTIFSGFNEFGRKTFIGNINEIGYFSRTAWITTLIETVHMAASISHTKLERSLTETVKATVLLKNTLIRSFTESVVMSIIRTSKLTRTITESVLLTINRTTEFTRTYIEPVHMADSFKRVYLIVLLETVRALDVLTKGTITIYRIEHVHITDIITKRLTRVLPVETVKATIILNWRRVLTLIEHVHMSQSIRKQVTRTYTVSVKATEVFTKYSLFVMRKLRTKVSSLHRALKIKLTDGRDVE